LASAREKDGAKLEERDFEPQISLIFSRTIFRARSKPTQKRVEEAITEAHLRSLEAHVSPKIILVNVYDLVMSSQELSK